jgi:hypothetical protein
VRVQSKWSLSVIYRFVTWAYPCIAGRRCGAHSNDERVGGQTKPWKHSCLTACLTPNFICHHSGHLWYVIKCVIQVYEAYAGLGLRHFCQFIRQAEPRLRGSGQSRPSCHKPYVCGCWL